MSCPTQRCHFEWPWVVLSDLAKYSITQASRSFSATAKLHVTQIWWNHRKNQRHWQTRNIAISIANRLRTCIIKVQECNSIQSSLRTSLGIIHYELIMWNSVFTRSSAVAERPRGALRRWRWCVTGRSSHSRLTKLASIENPIMHPVK